MNFLYTYSVEDFFMTRNEIVNKLAKDRVVEKIARKFKTEYKEDLIQYIYLYLLTQVDEDRLNEVYQNGEIKQFLTGAIWRQVISTTSYHFLHNVRPSGVSISKETRDGSKYEDTLVYEEDSPDLRYEKLYESIKKLTDLEQEIAWSLILPTYDRKDIIDRLLEEYNLTYKKYQKLVPVVKEKLRVGMGRKKPIVKKRGKNNTPIQMIDKYTGRVVKEYNNVQEAFAELKPLGFSLDAIYKTTNGQAKSTKGYYFRYI